MQAGTCLCWKALGAAEPGTARVTLPGRRGPVPTQDDCTHAVKMGLGSLPEKSDCAICRQTLLETSWPGTVSDVQIHGCSSW